MVTNGNFPGAPPAWELLEVGNYPLGTKASVIEREASEAYDKREAEKEAEFIALTKAFEEKCKEAGIPLPDEEPLEDGDEVEDGSYIPEFEPATTFG